MRRSAIRSLLLAAGIAMTSPSYSTVLLSDNFDTDAATSILNFNSLINWNVVNGTIDYIRSGGFGISCFGGAGGCIDTLGSNGTAGQVISKQTFLLTPGVNYTLAAEVSGNQRGAPANQITLGFLDLGGNIVALTTISGILSTDPFTLRSIGLSTSAAESVRLFFQSAGTNNVGPILDNVQFRDNITTRLPEPATLALLGIALAGLGFGRRRKV